MDQVKNELNKAYWGTLMWAVLFLFFFQLISDFVEGIYVFGLLGSGIPVEIVSVLFLFSPVLLLILPKKLLPKLLPYLGSITLVCRVIEPMLNTRGRMIVSGLGVAGFMMFLPIGLGKLREEDEGGSGDLGIGLLISILLSVFFRTVNSGWDISMYGYYQVIGWVLALVTGYQIWRIYGGGQEIETQPTKAGRGRVIGFCLGIAAVLMLLYFAFTSPNVIARWTGIDHLLVLVFLVVGLLIFAYVWLVKPGIFELVSMWEILIWNIIFVLALLLTILPHQIVFPLEPEGFPLLEPPTEWFDLLPAYAMLLTSPVILVDFVIFVRGIVKEKPSLKNLGAGFSLASLFMLLAIFGQVFTTVYDYIPVVGPFFRDKFWFVFIVLGAVMGFPILLLKDKEIPIKERLYVKPGRNWLIFAAVLGIASLVASPLVKANPQPMAGDVNAFRILTYNIQQGYNEAGEKNFDGQLAYILEYDPDILALEESDTNRIAGGNADLVSFFANRLNMYSYYGPKVVPGTFGIALLSKYPIMNPETYFLYSEGEQVAVILADIVVGDRTIKVVVTHLGNGGPMVQQQQLLELVQDETNVVAVGDYNFRPYEDQYALTISILLDATLLNPLGIQPSWFDDADRIDHVFISDDFFFGDAEYLVEPESDHPALYVDLAW